MAVHGRHNQGERVLSVHLEPVWVCAACVACTPTKEWHDFHMPWGVTSGPVIMRAWGQCMRKYQMCRVQQWSLEVHGSD